MEWAGDKFPGPQGMTRKSHRDKDKDRDDLLNQPADRTIGLVLPISVMVEQDQGENSQKKNCSQRQDPFSFHVFTPHHRKPRA